MDEIKLHKLLEIQYLKGRLDELHKAFPTVLDMNRSRKLDQRIQKYYNKLKSVDELAYHLYQVERTNSEFSKSKSKKEMVGLLSEIVDVLNTIELDNKSLILLDKIKNQIEKY
jgi:hypothetical protein